jgi:hypothetical protein
MRGERFKKLPFWLRLFLIDLFCSLIAIALELFALGLGFAKIENLHYSIFGTVVFILAFDVMYLLDDE